MRIGRGTLSALVVVGGLMPTVPGMPAAGSAASGGGPRPGSPAYEAADARNMHEAYGRIDGPGGQLRNPAYLPALVEQSNRRHVAQLLQQAASPTRPALTPGALVPGWNVGNPLRASWNGTRGRVEKVAFTNRYGALLRGHVYRPLRGARDPYTGRRLHGPFPGVVVTPGSVQGSEGMYEWVAQDLAERGYVVLTFDTQGQGQSETLPHTSGQAFPFCNPFVTQPAGETTPCPGVPSQQLSNFVVGTRNALSFFTSRPGHPYANPRHADVKVTSYNPYWRWFDRSRDPHPATPGRTTRVALVGHSMGAAAVSRVQRDDRRVATVVALDKLTGPGAPGPLDGRGNRPVVPALAVQSEYGFAVTPWQFGGGSSLAPQPSPQGPDPMRERRTGYDAWRAAGRNTMLVVPRASTHLEYTDIPLVLPASRYGQDVTSHYTQAWLNRYLKHRGSLSALTGRRFRYLEPVGHGRWAPIMLRRGRLAQRSVLLGLAPARGTRLEGRRGRQRRGRLRPLSPCSAPDGVLVVEAEDAARLLLVGDLDRAVARAGPVAADLGGPAAARDDALTAAADVDDQAAWTPRRCARCSMSSPTACWSEPPASSPGGLRSR